MPTKAHAALNLVVLRSADLDAAETFYAKLGLTFIRHRHGKGPEHLAAELPGCVFEIYPASADSSSSQGTRIGFSVQSLDRLLELLSDRIVSPAKDSSWGRRAVVCDPDGHLVELVERDDACQSAGTTAGTGT